MAVVAIHSRGVWRLRREIEAATGFEAVFTGGYFRRPRFDCVAGWGLKPSARAARTFARRAGVPFLSIEDGWLRSIEPGPGAQLCSLVLDWSGVHYEARQPNDLEAIITASSRNHDEARLARARQGIRKLRLRRLSKYNHAPNLDPAALRLEPDRPRVLVVDQTYGDLSIAGGLADERTFLDMLATACDAHPDAEIVVKTHPETSSGRKRGYLTGALGRNVRRLHTAVNPWVLIEAVQTVYTVSSQLGFEALLAGRSVHCFGMPYYAGWGLTVDRVGLARRTARPSLEQLFAALYFDYARYIDPDTQEPSSFEQVLDWLDRRRPRAAAPD